MTGIGSLSSLPWLEVEEAITMKYKIRGLQLEITTKCSFGCSYCPRGSFSHFSPRDMSMEVLRSLSPYFSELERVALYGYGEPTEGPLFEFLCEIRKEFDGDIVLVTNGSRSLLPLLEKLSPGVLVFSVDSISGSSGLKGATKEVLKNLRRCQEEARRKDLDLKIGSEIVLMKDNLEELRDLVLILKKNGASFVEITNLIPYFREMISRICYVTVSKGVFQRIFGREEEVIGELERSVYSVLKGVYSESYIEPGEIFEEFVADGYLGANPHLLEIMKEKGIVENFFRAVEVLSEISKESQIEVRAPRLLPDAKHRECPYLSRGFLYVRSDGKIAPCMEFSYSHPLWVNGHWKNVREVILGDCKEVEDVLRSKTLSTLFSLTKDFSSVPWCGDCPYSAMGCWYSEKNEVDCMGNSPSCNECLYSVGISKCLI